MPRIVQRLAVMLVLAVASVGCSGSDQSFGAGRGPCERLDDEPAAKAVLRCTEPSIAFLETELATGTAVIIGSEGKRFLLTNAHVVDPFAAADASIGGKTYEDVPVLGIDAAADIAVLGPLEPTGLPRPLVVTGGHELERGDGLFLIGYPGETDSEDLQATIASGIVSRVREMKEFGHRYIQTDASIGGGQSGGPLFDEVGNMVGVSGAGFADEFALALSGRNVRESMTRILAGKGDEYRGLPTNAGDAGQVAGALRVTEATDAQVLFLPEAKQSRTWHFNIDMGHRPVVTVQKMASGQLMAQTGNTAEVDRQVARELAKAHGGSPDDLVDPRATGKDPRLAARESAPGKFTIPVKPGESAIVYLYVPLTDAPVDVKWTSDLRLIPASRAVVEQPLAIGKKLDTIFGGFDPSVDALVELEAGQRVQLYVRAPQADPIITVFKPGLKLDHLTVHDPEAAGAEFFDDTSDGLFGLDAKTVYDVTVSGVYRIRINETDGLTTLIRFSVDDCAEIECDGTPAEEAKQKGTE